MALSETDRQALLTELGLDPNQEHLLLAPEPEAPAREPEPEPESEVPDVESLTDEQLLAPDAFERHKLKANEVGRSISSPHNKRLYARINEAKDRQRKAEQQAKREEKDARRKEERSHVREKVKRDTTERTAKAVLEALEQAGVDLDELVAMVAERKNDA